MHIRTFVAFFIVMGEDFLILDNITVRVLDKVLFDQLNLKIKKGEHLALIGNSGSGKTTLLQAIAGKHNVTHGEIHYCFYDDYIKANNISDAFFTYHQLISLVESKHHFRNLSNTTDFYYQQRYNSFDSEDAFTAADYLENVSHKKQPNYWNIDKVVTLLNLQPLLQKKIIKLSNGETKRLRLAASLLKNPVLLLLDNPLAGLDVQTRSEFNTIIQTIADSGINIILTTSPTEIPDTVSTVAVISDGTVKSVFPSKEFPAHLFTHLHEEKINKKAIVQLIQKANNEGYETIVSMKNVTIKYGNNTILSNVNWEILPGERWALLGSNGAGKSTLLSLLNGDNPQAYANDITIFDKKRGTGESIWDIKKKIGFVSPELYQYFPTDNNCLQIIESGYYDTLGLFKKSIKEQQDIALEWMKVLEIEKYAYNRLNSIPAAAQRLCLLARALIKNPPLLILDEPCQGLDSHQQAHIKSIIDTICDLSDVSLIYVSHYAHEIPHSVQHVLKLEKGEVIEN